MTRATVFPKSENHQHWSAWSLMALERLPLPYGWVVVLLGLLGAGSQIAEQYLRDPGYEHIDLDAVTSRLVFVGLLVYILLHLRYLKRAAVRGLRALRPSVRVDDPTYESHVARALNANRLVELIMFLVATAITLLFFLAPPREMVTAAGGLRGGTLLVFFVATTYAVLGWLVLTLLYTSIRYANGLGAMARCPLAVNVFDTGNLLPFGRLSLLFSLSTVGLILIPLIVLGPPRQAGILVIGISLLSLLALFVPLWGVHQQIVSAKQRVIVELAQGLMAIEAELTDVANADSEHLKMLWERTDTLLEFRRRIAGSPSWPFQDVGAIIRASAAALSPLVYLVLDQLIQAYIFPLLGSGSP